MKKHNENIAPHADKSGFSILELILTMAIIAILSVLAVAYVSNTSLRARDIERETDINSLARHLEDWYKNEGAGIYPSTAEIVNNNVWPKTNLKRFDSEIVKAPGAAGNSVIAALNTNTTSAGVLPQPTKDQYVYQPLTSSGAVCTNLSQECILFTLYYRNESTNAVIKKTSINR